MAGSDTCPVCGRTTGECIVSSYDCPLWPLRPDLNRVDTFYCRACGHAWNTHCGPAASSIDVPA